MPDPTAYYEYDADGWMVGWHNDATRIRSTTTLPGSIPPVRARFVSGVWVSDTTRETADKAKADKKTTDHAAALVTLKSYNALLATPAETNAAVAALILVGGF